jgi:hypothetical protein
MTSGGSSKLTGWKEIANYLDVTVRTAQLWEKNRGLPVHRLPGGGKPSVFSTIEELESWIRSNPDHPAPESESPATSRPRAAGLLRLAAIVAISIVVSVFAIIQIPLGPSTLVTEVVACSLDGNVLEALDSTGREVWLWTFPNMTDDLAQGQRRNAACIVQDVDGDDKSEILLLYRGKDRYQDDARLICLTPGMKRSRWEHPIGRRLERDGRVFDNAYIGRLVQPVEIGGVLHLILVARHSPSYPSEVILLEAQSGVLVDRYSHPGHLETVALGDLDDDGNDELLVGGINNPGPGPGRPVLALLDLPFTGEHGRSRQTEDFFGNPGPQELLYLSLPRSDADETTELPSEVREIGISDDGVVTTVVGSPNGLLTYTLDLSEVQNPRITSATAHTSFRLGHDALTDAGRLDHYLPAQLPQRYFELGVFDFAPDGNAP